MRAEYLASAAEPGSFPAEGAPEIAIAGRSNVGKSSLINALTGRRGLARTSSEPGRTRLLNFFAVERRAGAARRTVQLVDLPGYGYARVSRAERAAWRPLVEAYLERRRALRAVLLVVDARRIIEEEEEELVAYVLSLGREVVVVATKIDKLSRTERGRALASLHEALPSARQPIAFSSQSGEGRDNLWRVIERLAFPRPETGR